jgi:hypothetical protein
VSETVLATLAALIVCLPFRTTGSSKNPNARPKLQGASQYKKPEVTLGFIKVKLTQGFYSMCLIGKVNKNSNNRMSIRKEHY